MATKHVAVRLDERTLDQVDALIPALSTPWRRAKRSDVLRALIHAGLSARPPEGTLSASPSPPKQRSGAGRRKARRAPVSGTLPARGSGR